MKGGCVLVPAPSGNEEVTDLLPVLQSVLWGKARWRQLERGRLTGKASGRDVIRGRANGGTMSRAGTESQKETQGSLTSHQGLDWRPWGEKLQIPVQLCVFFFLMMWLVLGSHGKHLEDVGRAQLPLKWVEKEEGGHPMPLVFQAFLDLHFFGGLSQRIGLGNVPANR